MCDVKEPDIEHPTFEEGLKPWMLAPKVEIALGKVGQHIAKRRWCHVGLFTQAGKPGEEMKREASRTSAQFTEVHRFVTRSVTRRKTVLIAPKGKDNFRITPGNRRVAADVMGHLTLTPGLHSLLSKVEVL